MLNISDENKSVLTATANRVVVLSYVYCIIATVTPAKKVAIVVMVKLREVR